MRVEAESLKQQSEELSDLEAARDRILSDLRLGKQSSEYKRTKVSLDRFIAELRSQ